MFWTQGHSGGSDGAHCACCHRLTRYGFQSPEECSELCASCQAYCSHQTRATVAAPIAHQVAKYITFNFFVIGLNLAPSFAWFYHAINHGFFALQGVGLGRLEQERHGGPEYEI